jgi:chromosome segregation ATPase
MREEGGVHERWGEGGAQGGGVAGGDSAATVRLRLEGEESDASQPAEVEALRQELAEAKGAIERLERLRRSASDVAVRGEYERLLAQMDSDMEAKERTTRSAIARAEEAEAEAAALRRAVGEAEGAVRAREGQLAAMSERLARADKAREKERELRSSGPALPAL